MSVQVSKVYSVQICGKKNIRLKHSIMNGIKGVFSYVCLSMSALLDLEGL